MKKYVFFSLIVFLALIVGSGGSAAPDRQGSYDCTSATGITVGDCNALVSLYESANGATWNNRTGWLQTTTPCTWFGITCTGNQVTRIDLVSNNLTGSIPVQLGNIKTLQILRLRNNQLTGGVPVEILNDMPDLEEINLFANQLSSQLPNPSNLPSIQKFYVDDNKLVGVLPPGFGSLTTLVVLDVAANKIGGNLPNLSALTNLQELKLADNLFTGPLPNVSGATQLVQFYLQNNQFSGTIPAWLGDLPNLENMVLTNNQLTGTIPPQLGNATALTEFKLAFNKLEGTIPSSLGNLVNVEQFNIDGNKIGGTVPSTLTALTNVTSMDIGYNMLTASDPAVIAYLEDKDPNWDETQTIPPSDIAGNAQADGLLISWQLIPYVDNGGNYEVTCTSSAAMVVLVTTDKFTDSLLFSGLPSGSYTCSINTYTSPHNQNYNQLTSSSNSILVNYNGGNNAAPPNDLFANPIVLTKLGEQNYSYNIANATTNTDPVPASGVGNCNIASGAAAIHYDIPGNIIGGQKVVVRAGGPAWYRRQEGEQTAVDTAVVVYELDEARQLSTPINCDDDEGKGQTSVSNMEFTVEADKLYRLVVWNEGAAPQGAVIEIASATFDLVSPVYNAEFLLNQPPLTFMWKPIAANNIDSYSFQVARTSANTAVKFYLLRLTSYQDTDSLSCTPDLCTLMVAPNSELYNFLKFDGAPAAYLWSAYAAVSVGGVFNEYDSNQIFRFTVGDDKTPTPTSTSQTPPPTETPIITGTPPTSTPTSTENFVPNGGFEQDTDNDGEPNSWKVKNSTKDKHKCNKPEKLIAHSGECAFMFKGGAGENSRLQQTLDLSGETFAAGDGLVLSVYYYAKSSLEVKVKVKSTDGEKIGDEKATLSTNSGYSNLTLPVDLLSPLVGKVKVQFIYKSPSGKVFVDDVSLMHNPANAMLVPLP